MVQRFTLRPPRREEEGGGGRGGRRAGTHYCMGREEADWGLERVKDERIGAHNVKSVAGAVRVQEMDLYIGRDVVRARHDYLSSLLLGCWRASENREGVFMDV